jgi:catechol 2,3-dioxygenase-like lactoylglutathione lyase family enzyme
MRFAKIGLSIAVMLHALPVAAGPPANPLGLRPHHITASVGNLARATAWYQQMLGFAVRERGNHGPVQFVELSIPGFGVALIEEPGPGAPANAMPGGAPHWVHIVFSVPHPDAVFRLLKSKGAQVSTRENTASGPVHSFLVIDSEGNEIEIQGDSPR